MTVENSVTLYCQQIQLFEALVQLFKCQHDFCPSVTHISLEATRSIFQYNVQVCLKVVSHVSEGRIHVKCGVSCSHMTAVGLHPK